MIWKFNFLNRLRRSTSAENTRADSDKSSPEEIHL